MHDLFFDYFVLHAASQKLIKYENVYTTDNVKIYTKHEVSPMIFKRKIESVLW